MNVTDVMIRLAGPDVNNELIRAFAAITLDDSLVIRDIRIIEGRNGLVVAFPSKRITVPCHGCTRRNSLRSRFCHHCGRRLPEQQVGYSDDGRPRLHYDVAHPIRSEVREALNAAVLDAYRRELEAAKDPAHVSPYEAAYGAAANGFRRPQERARADQAEGAPLARRVERVRI